MVKTLRKDIYITALIITIGIFFLGLYVGKIWDDLRINQIKLEISENNLNVLSLYVNQEFFKSLDIDDCDLMEKRLSSMSYDLYKIGQKLNEYESKKLLNEKEYKDLKTQYFLLEIRAYVNFIESKKSCKSNQTIILYFYDIKDAESERQGYVLDKMVEREDLNIRVFSIDRQHEEVTLDLIKDFYDIKKSPTIIINNKIKKEGFVGVDELLGLVENDKQM